MKDKAPTVFISYSWTSESHNDWVINLGSELMENGVDVKLDKWDLKEGHDAFSFMEKMVSDPEVNKVILICDKEYSNKADERKGGVGTEAQIITPELYSKKEQDKFVAIVKERDQDGKPFLPVFIKSRIFIDLSDQINYASNFDQLLRWIYDKPLFVKPSIGKKPAFLNTDSAIDFGINSNLRRATNSISEGKENWSGLLEEVFETIVDKYASLRLDTNGKEIDEIVLNNISEFLPIRNSLIQLFSLLGRYKKNHDDAFALTHSFFENIHQYNYPSINGGSYREADFDNYRFINHELFLFANAVLIEQRAYRFVDYLLSNSYFLNKTSNMTSGLYNFPIFRRYLRSLEDYHKQKIGTNRISIQADLLKSRTEGSGVNFDRLMEADFVLYLRSIKCKEKWYPVTNLYAAETYYSPFELFARAQSSKYFNEIKILFKVENKEEMLQLINTATEYSYQNHSWDYRSLDIDILTGKDKLATLP